MLSIYYKSNWSIPFGEKIVPMMFTIFVHGDQLEFPKVTTLELQIRGSIEDNSKVIFLISQ